jgi:hypothetical protein
MVDPKDKFVHIVMIYVGCNNVVALIVEYDQKLLLPSLIEVYKLSMVVIAKELDAFGSWTNNGDFFCAIDITGDTLRDLVSRELYICCQYPIDGDSCNCTLRWWHT